MADSKEPVKRRALWCKSVVSHIQSVVGKAVDLR
jgi:hypothetical protein